MDSGLKKILRAISLELRHILEGRYDDQGRWLAGDLERRLNELGVWRDRLAKPLAELSHLSAEDKAARHIVDAYLRLRDEAGVARNEAVAEFVREAAYTWANRLFALRCMEARGIIDEMILQKETYGGRSMVHSRFARRNPEACTGADDGLFAVLFTEFTERAADLPVLFNPHAPAVVLRPSVTALKRCIALLSGREAVRGQEPTSDAVFEAPDAFGWAYQYWNAEEKDRVFEMVRTKKGAKIEGADIIPATCIYTEPYMVKFLVQNSLGALWMGMHPESSLCQGWEYYVKDADRAPVEKKPVAALTFLDPACGSGHFLLEAFDLLYTMYEEGTRGSGLEVREEARGSGLGAREGAREGARGSGLGAREGEGYEREQLSGTQGLASGHGAGGAGVPADMGVSQAGDVRTEQSNAASINIDSVQPGGGTQQGLDSGVSALHFDRHGLIGGTGDPTTHGRAIGIRAEDRIDPASHQDRRARQNASRPTKIPETAANPSDLVPSPQPLVPSPSSLASSPQSLASSPSSLVPPPQPLTPSTICAAILNNNLFGIDIDERAVQIAEAALWMKAKEKAPDVGPAVLHSFRDHLVATNIRLPKGKDHLQTFLKTHPEDQPLRSALEAVFQGLENAHELGSLLQIEEPVEKELRYLKVKFEENKGKLEQQALFAEVAQPKQGELPLGVESYERWKARTLARLRDHFGDEAEAADPVQAFFGHSAERGLALFDLLSRRYDVVDANPPYMGSGNMGLVHKDFMSKHYALGKRDLYAAFILRCRELAQDDGYVGMITLQSVFFLTAYAAMRATLLAEATIECLVHLGRHAFGEADPPGHPVLFCLRCSEPTQKSTLTAIHIASSMVAERQAKFIQESISRPSSNSIFRTKQKMFAAIPDAPFVYWAPNTLLETLASNHTISSVARVVQGISTGDNPRFVRFIWECPTQNGLGLRWIMYSNGGGYQKWAGLCLEAVAWGNDGSLISSYKGSAIRNREDQLSSGATYTGLARGKLGIRIMNSAVFSGTAPGLFPIDARDLYRVVAYLNTHLASYFARCLSPKGVLSEGYVSRIPAPLELPSSILGELGVLLKKALILSPVESEFREYALEKPTRPRLIERFVRAESNLIRYAALLHTTEAVVEHAACLSIGLSTDAVKEVERETGTPAGWYPLIVGYDGQPELPVCPASVPQELFDYLAGHSRITLSPQELARLKDRLRTLYIAGPGAQVEKNEEEQIDANGEPEDDEEGAIALGARIPIPAETFLEDLSQKLGIHPISVCWLLEEMRREEELVCPPELKRYTEDYFSVKVLRLLGHRWPKQIDIGEQIPDWADRDGIVPITEGSGEKTLLERVRDRVMEELPIDNVASVEREFEEIVDTNLAKWLASSFFKRHISQFKKRPIAWQIELGTREQGLEARKKKKVAGYGSGPVFSCLVYYHKLDADLLPKIRSQYVGPLKSGYETELRALERIESPTADQSARKVQLTNWIDELKALDEKFSEVIVSGFGPEILQGQLRQFAIDDAMLALKARWLRKLVGVVREGPLETWQHAAIDTELHPEFPEWIHNALTHLDHYCSVVGPKAPEEKTLSQDPDSTYLAALICREADAMVSGSLRRACQKWWKQFDEAVIGPIRQQIAGLNEQIKLRKEERDLVDLQTTPYRRVEIEREIEDLKDQVSALKDEQAQKVAVGQRVRAQIEGWTCPEAERWEPWLAVQPLYDQISSLDGRRLLPRTVAEFIAQESAYAPDINDGVRVNIVPLQRAGLLPAEVIAKKDLEKAIADRAEWRADERRWCREGKLPHPGWWKKEPGLRSLETEEHVILSRSAAEAKNLSAPRQKRDSSSLRSSE